MKLCKSLSLLVVGLGAVGLIASRRAAAAAERASGGTAGSQRPPPDEPGRRRPTSDTTERDVRAQPALPRRDGPQRRAPQGCVEGLRLQHRRPHHDARTRRTSASARRGADSAKQEDGNEGIDNAFGRTVLGFILGLVPTPSKTINDSIAGGSFTILLEVKGLTDDPKQTNTGLTGRLLIGGNFTATGKKPTFTPADDWPYRADPHVADRGRVHQQRHVRERHRRRDRRALASSSRAWSSSLTINRAVITFDHSRAERHHERHDRRRHQHRGARRRASRRSPDASARSSAAAAPLDTIKQTIRQASDIRAGRHERGRRALRRHLDRHRLHRQAHRRRRRRSPWTPRPPPDPCTADAGRRR